MPGSKVTWVAAPPSTDMIQMSRFPLWPAGSFFFLSFQGFWESVFGDRLSGCPT